MNIDSSFDYLLKIIIVGDTGVGKSNFLFRFVENKFSRAYRATVGLDLKTKICIIPKAKKKVKLVLWDTAGQERYMSLNKLYFQKVQGIILMYDITKRESFKNLTKWVKLINESAPFVPLVLIGNKLDDEEENRIVRTEEGKAFANENGYLFYESSALNGKNVNNAIYDLSDIIISSLEKSMNMNVSETTLENFPFNVKKKAQTRNERCC